ncbi:MAG: DUF2384 domain-containing protein [Alphaproteobacteria bacterium]|nr:MAG: DUF2384 domain-containing protein [Alphaproteobacteria bacterium]
MATALQEADVAAPEIVRAAELLGGLDIFDRPVTSSLDAHELISEGFPGAALTSLCENVTMIRDADTLEKAVGISLRTLQRRKAEESPKALSPEQSGRAWKFAELVAKAEGVFGSQDEAEHWLEEPAIGLSGYRPIDLLSTVAGTELVEQYLERIEFGVYT